MVRFLICPFKYDVQNKKLYITSNITLNLTLNDSPMMASIEDESQTDTMKELFKSQIINPEDFADEGIATLGLDIGGELITAKPKIEYIIVTSHTLAPYFKPLALWKKNQRSQFKNRNRRRNIKSIPQYGCTTCNKDIFKEPISKRKFKVCPTWR